ncbi:sugar phosphate nucleotidyltransferase [Ligilactobacillus salivarius]|uniref:sugar phosphate nucleotidyltransferase n=1 Tax=Ligilactobacillus salivarius TaxID=1624 RepID=UPI0013A672E6|nr:sugar phosphate nucleotidyltransferase [Ligilactobacillus salivarius]
MLNRYQFEVMTYIEKNNNLMFNISELANNTRISRKKVEKVLKNLQEDGNVKISDDNIITLTKEGLEQLEPYRVRRAIIMGAGFGSRMMPATKDRPKPMVTVNGKRIIETLLDAMIVVGITDITIVRGYQKEKYDELLTKYPFLNLIDNDDYATTNNISSVMKVLDKIEGGTYLCEADLYITNPAVITKYQYTSNILGSYSLETDDWSFRMQDGHIVDYQQGNTYCYNYYGISYWTADDCTKLRNDWSEIYATDEGKDIFWEIVPLKLRKEKYQVEIRECQKSDIMEIDNYYELATLDKKYNI